jgi:orotate phosphoribosyltransferase
MSVKNDSALKVAEFLLQIKAVKLQPANPFTWASGLRSPIYCDNRVTLSYPNVRTYIRQQLSNLVSENFPKPDAIVGVATGGIAQGALVAQDLGLPFAYVRSEAKSHGMKNLVEGHLEKGQTVVVVEDLVSTGKSSLAAVDALQEAGLNVKGMVAIFSYGFNDAKDAFDKKNIKLVTLTDYNILVEQALKSEYIKKQEVETLKKWRENPKEWSNKILI